MEEGGECLICVAGLGGNSWHRLFCNARFRVGRDSENVYFSMASWKLKSHCQKMPCRSPSKVLAYTFQKISQRPTSHYHARKTSSPLLHPYLDALPLIKPATPRYLQVPLEQTSPRLLD